LKFNRNSDSLINLTQPINEEIEFIFDNSTPKLNFNSKFNDLTQLKKIYKNANGGIPEIFQPRTQRNKHSYKFQSVNTSFNLNDSLTNTTESKKLLVQLKRSYDSSDGSV
jgi:hypothetical protein